MIPKPRKKATIDFETYSEAGFQFIEGKWKGIQKSKRGIEAVGAPAYAFHESTECICLCYDLHDGAGVRQWIPAFGSGPQPLFDHLAAGGYMEAHNAAFEYFIWRFTMVPKYGWPEVDVSVFECSAAKCRANGLPGSLAKAGAELMAQGKIPEADLKSARGKALINLLSIPHTPTKNKPWLRNELYSHMVEYQEMIEYCDQDVIAESSISDVVPALHPFEREVYHLDARINARGVRVDVESLKACQRIVEITIRMQTEELIQITEGRVRSAGQVAVMQAEINDLGGQMTGFTKDDVEAEIERLKPLVAIGSSPHLATALRILEIRATLSSASVKKIPAMLSRVCDEERVHGLFQYYGAATGRFAGRGPQPQNLPSKGPWKPWEISDVDTCLHRAKHNADTFITHYPEPLAAVSGCLRGMFIAKDGHDFISSDYSSIEAVTLACISGEQWRIDAFKEGKCIYLLSAALISGKDYDELIAYKDTHGDDHPLRKSLGKVAELACFGADTLVLTDSGWKRIVDITTEDLVHDGVEFVRHDGVIPKGKRDTISMCGVLVTPDHKIYTGSGRWETAKVIATVPRVREWAKEVCTIPCNVRPIAWSMYMSPEPQVEVYDIINAGPRSRFVVLTEGGPLIAHNSGYQGSVGAWKAFGADKFMKDDEEILANVRAWRAESPNVVAFWYGVESAMVQAIRFGKAHYKGFDFFMYQGACHIRLLSGRCIVYQRASVRYEMNNWGKLKHRIYFWSHNSDRTKGPIGWTEGHTYGGKITENINQATARDIMCFAMINLEKAGYPTVLHVHDETVCEVPEGVGSVEELESIMAIRAPWYAEWPIKASGGWRGKRYRKG